MNGRQTELPFPMREIFYTGMPSVQLKILFPAHSGRERIFAQRPLPAAAGPDENDNERKEP